MEKYTLPSNMGNTIDIEIVKILECSLLNVVTHKFKKVWSHKIQGFKNKKVKLKNPQVNMYFEAIIKEELDINTIYSDSFNYFRCVSPNKIVFEGTTHSFKIPNALFRVASSISEFK